MKRQEHWDASNGFEVGRKVLITQEPPKAKKHGFLYGTVHRIVEPPKRHLNSAMQVYLTAQNGDIISVQFPYWNILPKGVKFNKESWLKKHPKVNRDKAYEVKTMPVIKLEPELTTRTRTVQVKKRTRTNTSLFDFSTLKMNFEL